MLYNSFDRSKFVFQYSVRFLFLFLSCHTEYVFLFLSSVIFETFWDPLPEWSTSEVSSTIIIQGFCISFGRNFLVFFYTKGSFLFLQTSLSIGLMGLNW